MGVPMAAAGCLAAGCRLSAICHLWHAMVVWWWQNWEFIYLPIDLFFVL
jgi:hypothetical protein